MTLPTFTMRQMIEAGVHFGHHARRWNPKMAPYIFGKKDNVHIIDLQKTYPMLYTAMATTREIAAQGGKVLFVATKRQAQEIIKENAERCGQYYVNQRWLGGMLTNWTTVSQSIRRLKKMEADIENAEKLGVNPDFYATSDIHIHVPEGAVPKDGPSAGVTITTALVSILTGKPVRRDVAMTGEITLRGKVLPIGGLKEKTLAAYTGGVTTIIIPKKNEKDLEDIDKAVRDNVKFVPCSSIFEVLDTAFAEEEVIAIIRNSIPSLISNESKCK